MSEALTVTFIDAGALNEAVLLGDAKDTFGALLFAGGGGGFPHPSNRDLPDDHATSHFGPISVHPALPLSTRPGH